MHFIFFQYFFKALSTRLSHVKMPPSLFNLLRFCIPFFMHFRLQNCRVPPSTHFFAGLLISTKIVLSLFLHISQERTSLSFLSNILIKAVKSIFLIFSISLGVKS